MFNTHFGVSPVLLENIPIAESNGWTSERRILKGFGRAVEYRVKQEEEGRTRVRG